MESAGSGAVAWVGSDSHARRALVMSTCAPTRSRSTTRRSSSCSAVSWSALVCILAERSDASRSLPFPHGCAFALESRRASCANPGTVVARGRKRRARCAPSTIFALIHSGSGALVSASTVDAPPAPLSVCTTADQSLGAPELECLGVEQYFSVGLSHSV